MPKYPANDKQTRLKQIKGIRNKKKIDLLMAASIRHIIIKLMVHLSEASFVLFTLTRTKVKNNNTRLYNASSIMSVMKSDF